MSFPTPKKSILALQLLGAASIASLISLVASPSLMLSQVGHNTEAGQAIAYRASGRFDTALSIAYRASGRFGIEVNNILAYRGSERGIKALDPSEIEVVAYRASGRLDHGFEETIAYRASGRLGTEIDKKQLYRGSERGVEAMGETVAYRASGRLGTAFNGGIAYRGSERGVGDEVIG